MMRSPVCRILSVKPCSLLEQPASSATSSDQPHNYSHKQSHRIWHNFDYLKRWPLGDELGFTSAQAGRGPPYGSRFQVPCCQGQFVHIIH